MIYLWGGGFSKTLFVKVTRVENYLKLIIWCKLLAISRQVSQNSFKAYVDEVSDMSKACSLSLTTPLTHKLHHIVLIVNLVHSVGGLCVRLDALHIEMFVYFICT